MKRLFAAFVALFLLLAGCSGQKASPLAPSSSASTSVGTPEENLRYTSTYLSPLLNTGALAMDFGPNGTQSLSERSLLYSFEELTGFSQMEKYWAQYDGSFPTAVVEDCLTTYFDLTPQAVRSALFTCYRPTEGIYYYDGRRSCASMNVQVDASRKTGDVLELDYTLLSLVIGGKTLVPIASGTLTLRLEGDSWRYLSNHPLPR